VAGLPQVGEEFADYKIVRELGRGGMGVVFEATQAKLGHRRVALKVLGLQHAADPQYRKRFQREASSLASLNSPHVIHIYEYGEFDGCLYIATQLISDGDLRTWLDRHGPLELETALRLVEQVTFAVADAHAVNVIHRDIKPSNVLLRRDGEGEFFAYLCDFGIVAIADADHTNTANVLGTYGYVAPERHLGEPASRASDVYSLGCLLWCTVTGAPPYGEDGVQAAIRHMHDPIPQLDGAGPAVEAANAILETSMAKAPAGRYTSAAAMRTLLVEAAALAGQAPEPASIDHGSADPPSEPNEIRPELDPVRTGRVPVTAPLGGVGEPDDHDSQNQPQNQPEGRPARRRKRSRQVAAAVIVLILLGVGVVAVVSSLDSFFTEDATTSGSSSPSPPASSTGEQAPAPFETQSLYAFTRGLFPPSRCEVPVSGERPFLEQNPDAEQATCEGDRYSGIFFRKQTLAGLREERPLYLGEALPGTVREIPEASSEEGLLDGPQYVYVHDDGTTRIYWESESCLCAGVIQAPDSDADAALSFWASS